MAMGTSANPPHETEDEEEEEEECAFMTHAPKP